MSENIERDICDKLEYMPITFFSNKLRIGIIGGGKGSYIKARSLKKSGAFVEILSKEFIDDFKELDINKIKDKYNKKFILDKHIVIIAISDEKTINEIITDCNDLSKIYINSTDFKNGMAVIPVKRESKNICISVNTKLGNPKGSVMIGDQLKKEIDKYDDFIEFSSIIRNNLDIEKDEKIKLLSFINSEDFKFIFDKGKYQIVLDLFYKEKINGISFSYKKK